MAAAFVLLAIADRQYIVLGMIGLFIFMMAHTEYKNVKLMSFLKATTLEDIMKENFSRIALTDYYDKVLNIYNQGEEKNFLVFNAQGQIVGAVPEIFIQDFRKDPRENPLVSDRLSAGVGVMKPQNTLYDAYRFLNTEGISIVGIIENNLLRGVVDRHLVEALVRKGNT